MRIVKTAVAVAAATAGLFTGGITATAAPAGEVGASSALYTVTAWHDVNVRSCASTACLTVGSIVAGQSRKVACWVHGESVTDYGITNDIWLQVGGRQEGGTQWSSAVYFAGDEYANLPADAQCPVAPEPAQR
ncbi:SH3 domain-containing protein [Saccharothrix deserti]|uniref:SH3 domain-containing protein n=1 Tax=Saccharothrix deserti TaxID=2593674 RepID=UPI00131C63B5|nr:SH3 domain-containing protein [Saccharothrix deserti]